MILKRFRFCIGLIVAINLQSIASDEEIPLSRDELRIKYGQGKCL